MVRRPRHCLTTSVWYIPVNTKGNSSNVQFMLARTMIYNRKCIAWQSCGRHNMCATIARATHDDEGIVQQSCDSRTKIVRRHRAIVRWFYRVTQRKYYNSLATVTRQSYEVNTMSTYVELVVWLGKYFEHTQNILRQFYDVFYFVVRHWKQYTMILPRTCCKTGLRWMWKGL